MIIKYMELPLKVKTEDDLYSVLSLKPEIIGKGAGLLLREFQMQNGSCDIVGKQGDQVLLIELKVSQAIPTVEARERYFDQVKRYMTSFQLLCRVLGVSIKALPVLVVAIAENLKGRIQEIETDDPEAFEEWPITEHVKGLLEEGRKVMEEGRRFERLKETHSDELEQLRQEEKNLRKTIASLSSQTESWDETARKRAIVKEIQVEQRRLDSVRDAIKQAREENRMIVAKSKTMLNTLDDRNVYRTDYSGGGISSILAGRIEGEKFVWQKPYLDMFGAPANKGEGLL